MSVITGNFGISRFFVGKAELVNKLYHLVTAFPGGIFMDKNASLLEFETLTMVSEFCRILDKSNDYFLLSRFASTHERREYFLKKYEQISKKTDFILTEARVFLPLIKEIVCLKKR